jgi:hypothetical protein
MRRWGRREWTCVLAWVTFTALEVAGCSFVRGRPPKKISGIKLVAVMPLVRATRAPEPRAVTVEVGEEMLAPDAEKVVTAQIYGTMAESSQWRFVPDLTVDSVLDGIPRSLPLPERARKLGEAVHADGVLYGSVSRFRNRQGSEFGTRHPASVSFSLALMDVANGHTVWRGNFDETQQALTTNLFNWWQFWRAGPKWFTAQELARLGVEKLLKDLRERLD